MSARQQAGLMGAATRGPFSAGFLDPGETAPEHQPVPELAVLVVEQHHVEGLLVEFRQGSGLLVKLPVIDMIEIGAGGGSIAAIDEVGLLKVGPHSAGSDPGPACYGRGGTEPTSTDAQLMLGRLRPDRGLLGDDDLVADAAREEHHLPVREDHGSVLGHHAEPVAVAGRELACHGLVEPPAARGQQQERTRWVDGFDRAGHRLLDQPTVVGWPLEAVAVHVSVFAVRKVRGRPRGGLSNEMALGRPRSSREASDVLATAFQFELYLNPLREWADRDVIDDRFHRHSPERISSRDAGSRLLASQRRTSE